MALSDLYQLSSVTNDDENDDPNHQVQEQLLHVIDTTPQAYSSEPSNTITPVEPIQQPKVDDGNETKTSANKAKIGNRKQRNQRSVGQPVTRFKWTKEMMQVAMNLLKYGCKPKIISVAVGCSIRTAQKFAETVTPREEGQSFREYEVKRRGRKHKDTNPRLEAIREVLNKDCTKTQVEIAANLKVSNTTVCRDLKKLGTTWRERKK